MRTQALARGERLSDVTRALCARFGVEHAILPMTDEPVRTVVLSDAGELPFQDYFVHRRCEPCVSGFRFDGAESARPPEALACVLANEVEAVIVCPSNPFISIAPILTVERIRAWLEARRFPVIAVSPIIGGDAVKGPAAKMMRELGLDASAAGIARHYGALVDGWVIDSRDAHLAPAVEAHGKRVWTSDTLMTGRDRSVALAGHVLDCARRFAKVKTP